MHLDEIDRRLLQLLQADASLTIKALAEELTLSTTPVHERIKRLERRGIIKHRVALLDPKKIGQSLSVFVSVSLKEHHRDFLQPFISRMQTFPEVMECYHITGSADFLLKVVVPGMEQYQAFILDKLSVLKSIAHVQSSFVLSENKHTTAFQVMDT